MTQKSSLINWLVDFCKRCFAKNYVTKARGKSPSTHNWRECPECKKYIWTFSFNGYEDKVRCDHCNAALGVKKSTTFCSCGAATHMACTDPYCVKCKKELPSSVMEYKDRKGRIFTLFKPLYNPRISLWTIVTIILMMCMMSIYHFVKIPYGFSIRYSNFLLWDIITFNLCAYVLYYVARFVDNHMKFVPILIIISISILVAILLFLAMPVRYSTHALSPRWVHAPTEQEWRQQQLAEIDALEPGLAQFELVHKLENVNWQPYYVAAAKVDFEGLMRKYGSYANQLDPWYGAQFFPLLNKYLKSLSQDELMRQCCDDPWNVIFTPLSVQRFGNVVTACDNIMP